MKVLITGAGLLGSNAADALLRAGHRVALYDHAPLADYVRSVVRRDDVVLHRGDVANLAALTGVMLHERPECVVHTGGVIGGLAQRDPYAGFRTNLYGAVCVAEAARLSGASRVVFASTHGVYDLDACRDRPITEDAPVQAASVYSASKLSSEHVLQAYGHAYGFDVVILRFTNVFGRGTYAGGSSGGANFDALIRGVARNVPAPVLPSLIGHGEWLYAKDAGLAVALACGRPLADPGYVVVNVGSGTLHDENDIMAAARAAAPSATFEKQVPDGAKRGTVRHQPYDLATARTVLGFEPRFDLRSAIADYLEEVAREEQLRA